MTSGSTLALSGDLPGNRRPAEPWPPVESTLGGQGGQCRRRGPGPDPPPALRARPCVTHQASPHIWENRQGCGEPSTRHSRPSAALRLPACRLGPPSWDRTPQARAGSAPTHHTWTMTRTPRTITDRSQLPSSETSLSLPHPRWSPPKSVPQQEVGWAPRVHWSVSLRGPTSQMGVSLPRGGQPGGGRGTLGLQPPPQ